MPLKIIVRHQGEIDITDAAVWYHSQHAGLGHEFLTSVELAMAAAAERPRSFPRLRRTPEVRRALLDRFPYRVFFIVRDDAIVVFRVLHGSRHDREWRRTLRGE